jgi:hypothetical protein
VVVYVFVSENEEVSEIVEGGSVHSPFPSLTSVAPLRSGLSDRTKTGVRKNHLFED